ERVRSVHCVGVLNLDPAKLAVIFVVALVVLGPERLPRVARQLGAAWRELTRVRDQITDEVRSAIPEVEGLRVPYRPGAISDLLRSPLSTPVSSGLAGASAAEPVGTPEVPSAAVAPSSPT